MHKIILLVILLKVGFFPVTFAQNPLKKEGRASFYGVNFHGKTTANGEIFNMNLMTAAHPRLPFHSLVKVTNTHNNKSVIVRINDRGPFSKNRIIDLSKAAAEKLEMIERGTALVTIEVLKPYSIQSIYKGL
jgi:rare lipoprotein A